MAKQVQLDAKGHRKFGIRDKLAYAAGDLGCNMSFSLKGTVQTFWLVYMMMETGLFSLLLLIVQAWDAINDPIIGSLIDNDTRKYKIGKYKTYILIGAIGLLVGGAAVFLPFPKADTVVKAILFVLGYIVWDAAYTMANVPYGTMLNIITEDDQERASLSVFRSIGGAVGGMLPGVVLPMLIWQKVTFDPKNPTWFLDRIEIPKVQRISLLLRTSLRTLLPARLTSPVIPCSAPLPAVSLRFLRVTWYSGQLSSWVFSASSPSCL